jgi:branched-chain amino acid transport system permease protein
LIADPKLFGANLAVRQGTDLTRVTFCFTVLAIVTIFTLLTARILRGDTGRAFLAVRSNERAAASVGINVAWCKLTGFAISAFIAGIAGTLIGYSRGQLSAESFTALTGLSMLAIVYLGGIGSISGAIMAGITGPLGVAYVFLTDTVDLGQYYILFTGVGLVMTAIFNPIGIAGMTRLHWERNKAAFLKRRARRRPAEPALALALPSFEREQPASAPQPEADRVG